jgi:fluoride ion exporter CrcB/FEX
MLESWRLVEEGDYLYMFGNLLGSAVVGMAAVVAGLAIGRLLA